jgi:hypothetical protein
LWYKELVNSHRKNRRYAYFIYVKDYDKRIDKFCLWVLRGRAMRRKFYMHKRGGVFYACLANQEMGLSMNARNTGERDRDAALIVVSGWLGDGLPGKDGERRKVEAAFDLEGILRGIRKAELDSGGALAIVNALKERGLIDIGAVPAGKGSVDFVRLF